MGDGGWCGGRVHDGCIVNVLCGYLPVSSNAPRNVLGVIFFAALIRSVDKGRTC